MITTDNHSNVIAAMAAARNTLGRSTSTHTTPAQLVAKAVSVEAGQIWRDKRVRRNVPPQASRQVLILASTYKEAVCQSLNTGNITIVPLKRFNRGCTGFEFVSQGEWLTIVSVVKIPEKDGGGCKSVAATLKKSSTPTI